MASAVAYVATLIAGPESEITDAILADCTSSLPRHSISVTRQEWLQQKKAVDLFCESLSAEAIYGALKPILDLKMVDIIAQPITARHKKVLLADMESTMIEQELLDEMAKDAGFGEKVAEITCRAMNGELDFISALKERVAMFRGQSEAILAEAAARITPMSGAHAFVNKMKEQGAACWLVTGGFDWFAIRVADMLGFDRVFSNNLVMADGRITGKVTEPIVDKETKKQLLGYACEELRIKPHECMAIGDGANDIPMLTTCNANGGLGVAYRAKPVVRQVVPHQLNFADLSAMVYV